MHESHTGVYHNCPYSWPILQNRIETVVFYGLIVSPGTKFGYYAFTLVIVQFIAADSRICGHHSLEVSFSNFCCAKRFKKAYKAQLCPDSYFLAVYQKS